MALDGEPTDLDAAIAAALRARRVERQEGQEDLARRARDLGLDWTRASVANLEAGKKRLTVGELLAVPLLYEMPLDQLLPQQGQVVLGGTLVVEGQHLVGLLTGSGKTAAYIDSQLTAAASVIEKGDAERWAARKLEVTPTEVAQAALDLWGHGLTHEREHRLTGRDITDQSRRITRGHVTRQLLAELRTYFNGNE